MEVEKTPSREDSNDSRVSSLGRRHTPTARISERKRTLFDKRHAALELILDDDVDLGPMSPLQYSSSPTSQDEELALPFDRSAKQTDFSNLFSGSLKKSAAASPSSTSYNSPFSASQKSMLVVEDSASGHVHIPASRLSDPPQPLLSEATEMPTIPEEHKMLQEKTPSERMINCQELRVSFKKSLILGDLVTPSEEDQRTLKPHQKRSYSMSVLSEKNSSDGAASTSPKEKVAKLDAVDASRARTSLTFDGISIPTSRFYSGQNDENSDPGHHRQKRNSAPMLLARDYNPHRASGGSRGGRRSGGGVAQKGCGHKIKRPAKAPGKEALKRKVELAVLQHHGLATPKQQASESKEESPKETTAMTVDEAQDSRIHEILRNIKNPLEMSRPLFFKEQPDEDRFNVSDEEEVEAEADKGKKKFFKSGGTTGAKSYKLTDGVVATVAGGRITLPKFPAAASSSSSSSLSTAASRSAMNSSAPNAAEFSMVDDEFNDDNEEVTDILSMLANDDAMDAFRNRLPCNTTDPDEIQRQTQLLELLIENKVCTEENFRICIAEWEQNKEEAQRLLASLKKGTTATAPEAPLKPVEQSPGLFPIFYPQQAKQKLVSLGGRKERRSGEFLSRKVWKRIGDAQLQIDAGQKRFGATYCAECDLLYSVHEPEDELMHQRFHGALAVLRFTGWKAEQVIRTVPGWGLDGRVIAVPANDHKVKVHRVLTVLNVVNKEMGCPNLELRPKTIVYLAVAQSTILGVCVAEAKYEANRLVTEAGVDYFSEEVHPVWCGVTRVWVAAPYRNQGVATELVNAVRSHFTVGRTLSTEEIAFQSPTEAGKLLAKKLAGRSDFLVYP